MIWPWLERLEALEKLRNIQLELEKHPNLSGYIARMKQDPAVKESLISSDDHVEFYKSYISGEPNYDAHIKA